MSVLPLHQRELLKFFPQRCTQRLVPKTKKDIGAKVVHPVTRVETSSFHAYGQHATIFSQRRQGIGKLKFPSISRFAVAQIVE